MDELIAYLDIISPLTTAIKEELYNIFEALVVPKGTVFFKGGKVNPNAYFIASGIVRCYRKSMPSGKKDISIWFLMEGDFIANKKHFQTGQLSLENFEALEDSVVVKIPWMAMFNLVQQYPELLLHLSEISFAYASVWHDLFTGYLLSDTAEANYHHIATHFPRIIQRVPQKYLASFLGISPEHLSSIKRKWSGKR